METPLDAELGRELEAWEEAGLRRTLDDAAAPHRADFVSNDYLGLARHPDVVEAARAALAEHGAGAGAARLLGGGGPAHAAAERAAAEWLGAEAALLFPSGYQANLGVAGALVGRGDVLFSDALNHASLVDAARLSRARVEVYPHLDLDDLARRLGRSRGARRRLVVTESIFSMDGDLAPLAELHAVCAEHDAWLVVDEAHAAGLLGPRGAGAWSAAAEAGPTGERLAARVVTGGKALGVGGAFVVGSRTLVDLLLHRARSFLFTTSPPPSVAAALARAIEVCAQAEGERAKVHEVASTVASELGLTPPGGAIVPLPIGDSERAMELAGDLRKRGLDVRAVRPPTVPEGSSRLRIVAHASNTEAEVDDLVRGIRERGWSAQETQPKPLAPVLFVVGTDTGIGKTVVSALLVRGARRAGPVRYWKAVQTGEDSDTDEVQRLSGAEPHELLRPAWSLPLPASPHEAAAAAGVAIEPERLDQGLLSLRRLVPEAMHIVELAGGLLVPYVMGKGGTAGVTQADWLERAKPPLVLIARSGLGTLNHTLLTLEALRARHLEPRALFLVGETHPSNRETLREMGALTRVFEVPFFELLDEEALDRWLDRNDLAEVFAP
ncbi:MAG: dethiobiotin synthase [Planctomycetota bacterium]